MNPNYKTYCLFHNLGSLYNSIVVVFFRYPIVVPYPINNLTIIKQTAPGNPNNPMIMLLTIFNPI